MGLFEFKNGCHSSSVTCQNHPGYKSLREYSQSSAVLACSEIHILHQKGSSWMAHPRKIEARDLQYRLDVTNSPFEQLAMSCRQILERGRLKDVDQTGWLARKRQINGDDVFGQEPTCTSEQQD